MNDLPTTDGNSNGVEDKNPLLATLEAMKRLKDANKALETRVENLEKAFEMAFKNGAASLQEFLANLDVKDDGEVETGDKDETEVKVEGGEEEETEASPSGD